MILTEKGYEAIQLIGEYYPTQKFSAAMLSEKSQKKISANTLSALSKKDILTRFDTSPVLFKLKEQIDLTAFKTKEKSGNDNLHKALKKKNDEFYTFYKDIEAECNHYSSHFVDKVIYLNCDDENSQFWKYFIDNFQKFKIKELIATHLSKEKTSYKISTLDGVSIQKEKLKGNGDFNSEECQEILKECDIVITNPPFSLFREMVSLILKYKKLFLVIGNENTFASTEIFPLIKDNIIWTGFNKVKQFFQPDGTTQDFGNICWFTNLENDKEIPFLSLKAVYNEIDYPKYENYDAINVDKVSLIPRDYYGIMGIPISYLSKYNQHQFEIMGLAAGNSKNHKLYFTVPYTPHELDRGGSGIVNGIRKYSRVFVKRKEKDFEN